MDEGFMSSDATNCVSQSSMSMSCSGLNTPTQYYESRSCDVRNGDYKQHQSSRLQENIDTKGNVVNRRARSDLTQKLKDQKSTTKTTAFVDENGGNVTTVNTNAGEDCPKFQETKLSGE